MPKQPALYIVASERNGTIYTGFTTNLVRRAYEHRMGLMEGFSKKYGTKMLVYYEIYDHIEDAALRERRMKKWNRQWKLRLIEKMNPDWEDLYKSIL